MDPSPGLGGKVMRRREIVLTGAIVSCLTAVSAARAADYSAMGPLDAYLVDRSWMSQYDFPQFWNPHMRGPLCYNPAAVRSILPYTIRRTELVLAGRTKPEMVAAIKDGIEKHTLPHLEAGALTYMMSRQQNLNDNAHNWVPHLMFYFPRADGADWGADLPGAPPMLNPQFQESPEAISVIMVPVTHWSDGTPAPMMR